MTTSIAIYPAAEQSLHLSPYQQRQARAPEAVNDAFFGSFADVIDLLNPLQHIPVVSTLYQAFSGDAMGPGARIGGGALFGGPMGMVAALVGEIADSMAGEPLATHLFATATGRYARAANLKA